MGLNPSRDVFITCAVTGSGDTVGRSDKVPVTPRQIADAAIEAANAGAARPEALIQKSIGMFRKPDSTFRSDAPAKNRLFFAIEKR